MGDSMRYVYISVFCFLFRFLVPFTTAAATCPQVPDTLKLAVFDVDATPPAGSWLAYDSMTNNWDLGLRAKGIVITGSGRPIVLCCVDWIGIANEGHDAFRITIAEAAGTTPERVAVQTIHQHDAPTCDFGAEDFLKNNRLPVLGFESGFQKKILNDIGNAIKNAIPKSTPFTHIGLGKAKVHQVASNRRILGTDGKVMHTRTSATRDSLIRAAPEGLIDPDVSLVSFWNNEKPLAIMSYYATHPQSYYRTGVANPDIPGVARFLRQLELPDVLSIHFNGASGNITVGKYNDGSHINRLILAERLAQGMKQAWESTSKFSVMPKDIGWTVQQVALPPKKELQYLDKILKTETSVFRANNTSKYVWWQRLKAGKKIDISCLGLGNARIINLPGEPFVEFQLNAKAMRPDLFVAVAGYGDYAPGYIGTAVSYSQGGYETGQASAVTSDAEKVLLKAIKALLK